MGIIEVAIVDVYHFRSLILKEEIKEKKCDLNSEKARNIHIFDLTFFLFFFKEDE